MAVQAPLHPDHPLRRAAVALAFSLGLHALLAVVAVAVLAAAADAARKREAAQPKPVAIAVLDSARWDSNRALAKRFVPTAAFDTSPDDAARPERARFLSDRDRRVDRETVAAPAPGAPGKQGAPGERAAERPPPSAKPAGGSPLPAPGTDGPGSAPVQRGPDLRPRPTVDRPLAIDLGARGDGGVPLVDGVAVGGLTVLNAEAWRFATFFDRVGDTLYGVWRVEFLPRPPPLSVIAHPRGGLSRVALDVALDASGRAVQVKLRKSSGQADIDSLLTELVQRSAPFPNVPAGLLDARGLYSDVWILALVWGRQGP